MEVIPQLKLHDDLGMLTVDILVVHSVDQSSVHSVEQPTT